MSLTRKTGTVPVAGGELPYLLVIPDSGRGPGIVLCYEIFGLSQHMIERAERLAGLGYVVMVPDFFWRIGPRQVVEELEPDGMQRAMHLGMQLDRETAAADGAAALAHLRDQHEVSGGAGVFGYCMGGMIAYLIATRTRPEVAVLYYPSGVDGYLDRIHDIHCPTLYEFGAEDAFMPPDIAGRVREATAHLDGVQVEVQPGAGHAFDNDLLPQLHNADAAAAAWTDAQRFLGRWLPAGG
ncbi:MAG: dienelactone hydrolase family protein [Candidatus Dormibacteraeota bacterium]|nr:dienelactone hydrolase family protein [Candidatus Dormibacteraeota bacterium]